MRCCGCFLGRCVEGGGRAVTKEHSQSKPRAYAEQVFKAVQHVQDGQPFRCYRAATQTSRVAA
eukprot:2957135-Amphidinium_carterae.2